MEPQDQKPASETTAQPPDGAIFPFEGKITLNTESRLKLARGILDKTCVETGAGYVLIMFVPGTDLVLRSFKGLDTPQECVAATHEVVNLLKPHMELLVEAGPKPKHNDA